MTDDGTNVQQEVECSEIVGRLQAIADLININSEHANDAWCEGLSWDDEHEVWCRDVDTFLHALRPQFTALIQRAYKFKEHEH